MLTNVFHYEVNLTYSSICYMSHMLYLVIIVYADTDSLIIKALAADWRARGTASA